MHPSPVVVGNPDLVFQALRSRKTWILALAGATLGAVVGVGWVVSTPKTFKATVAMELTEISPQINVSGVGPRADAVTIDTDAQIVLSDAVVKQVAEATANAGAGSGTTPEEVRENLTVSARPLTQVMTITFAADDAARAVEGATVAAEAFLDERQALISDPVQVYLDAVSEPIANDEATKQGVTRASEANLWRMEQRGQTALIRRIGLQGPGTILEAARASAGEWPNREVPVATGIGLGALAGVAVAVIWERRRRGGSA